MIFTVYNAKESPIPKYLGGLDDKEKGHAGKGEVSLSPLRNSVSDTSVYCFPVYDPYYTTRSLNCKDSESK